ncbi:MAG: HAMP domain-containing sensor histidine kinase [Cyanobacteria bacterium J06597_1]
MELSETFEALGARVVFFDSQSERWLWADGIRSDRFTHLFPTPSVPARVSGEDGELLPFNVMSLPAADPPESNARRAYSQHASEYRYICLLERREDGDEYVSIATEVPLTLSQQRSVNQRVHLLHDYLHASRPRSQDTTSELEQRIQKAEHQIRNPLAAIELFADTLMLQLPPGQLRKQAEAIQTTIRDLDERLSLFQRPVHRPTIGQQCDLRSIALDAIAVLQHSWQAKQIFISIPDGPLPVTVNPSQTKQVFENVLSNAIYFSPPASVITCEWEVVQQEITVKVSDRGPGLSPEDIESVFSPHYSRRPGGRGLGLAIAKSFIREQGGEIWCRSLPTGGAQFCFTLSSLATH